VAQQHLELVRAADGAKRGSLLAVLDTTRTSAGARLLRKWLLAPLVDVPAIRRRQDAVEALVRDSVARSALRAQLERVGDIERLAVRAVLGEANPRDLGVLRDSLQAAPEATAIVAGLTEPSARDLLGVGPQPPDVVDDLCRLLRDALVEHPPALARDGGIFRESFDPELHETSVLQKQGADLIVAMEAQLRADASIPQPQNPRRDRQGNQYV
jgi:DNA mismatch repair protein MutS